MPHPATEASNSECRLDCTGVIYDFYSSPVLAVPVWLSWELLIEDVPVEEGSC